VGKQYDCEHGETYKNVRGYRRRQRQYASALGVDVAAFFSGAPSLANKPAAPPPPKSPHVTCPAVGASCFGPGRDKGYHFSASRTLSTQSEAEHQICTVLGWPPQHQDSARSRATFPAVLDQILRVSHRSYSTREKDHFRKPVLSSRTLQNPRKKPSRNK
jgi:hypothetical protein